MSMPFSAAVPRGGDVSGLVDAEQVLILYRRVTPSTIFGVAFALLMVMFLRPHVGALALWSWFGLKTLTAAARLVAIAAHQHSKERGATRWKRYFTALLALDSLGWGLAGVWLIPYDHPGAAALVLGSLVGVAAVGAFVLQTRYHAVRLFIALVCLPAALLQLLRMDTQGLYAGVGMLIFVGLMLWGRSALTEPARA